MKPLSSPPLYSPPLLFLPSITPLLRLTRPCSLGMEVQENSETSGRLLLSCYCLPTHLKSYKLANLKNGLGVSWASRQQNIPKVLVQKGEVLGKLVLNCLPYGSEYICNEVSCYC